MKYFLRNFLIFFILSNGSAFAQQGESQIDSLLKVAYQKLDKNNDEALALATQCLDASQKLGYKKGEAVAYMQIGRVYRRKGNSTTALENYIKAVKIFEKLNDFVNLASVNNSIAIIYLDMGEYQKTIDYENVALYKLRQAKSISHSDSTRFINIYNQLGAANYRLQQYEQAHSYFLKALNIAELTSDKISEGITLDNISKIYIAKKEFEKALSYTQKAYQLKLNGGDVIDVANTMLDLGIIKTAMGKNGEALNYYKQAYKLIVDSIHDMNMRISGLINLSKGYKNVGDYKNAFIYQSMYIKLSDSITGVQTNEKIVQMDAFYQSEKKKSENESLQLQNDLKEENLKQVRNQKQVLIFGLILLLLFTTATIYYLVKSRRDNIQLKKLNGEKTNVMAAISHDMRSPFVKIDTLIKLQMKKNPGLNELQPIKSIVDESMNMLTNILDVSYLEDKTPILRPSEVDILELMQFSVEENLLYASRKQITLKLDVLIENIIIETDPNLLKRIINNLITNAIKYSYPDSQVEIEVKSAPGNKILFSIRDHGQGISGEEKKKLFMKYEKLSSKPTGGELSTGLGLYLSKWIVELLRGKIWCESRINEGSVFYLELPHIILQKV